MTVGVERRVDDIRFPFAQFFIAQAQRLHPARAVVLCHNVGAFQQAPEHVQTFLGFQIQQYAAFPPVDLVVGIDCAAAGWIIDLDNVGAVLGQRSATRRSGENDAQVEHFDAFQHGTHSLFDGLRRRNLMLRRHL